MKGVLITGANGNVGSRLVKAYLDQPDTHVYALVRGNSPEEAGARMETAMDFWDIPRDVQSQRCTVFCGDVSKDQCGLKTDQINQLKMGVQYVIHAASKIRLNVSLEESRQANVYGTQNVVKISKSLNSCKRFGFVSTLEVGGDYKGILREEFLDSVERGFLNQYGRTKAEAETYLKSEIQNGFPVTIFRPSMVVGESTTGKALGFQSFYLALEKLLLNPKPPIVASGLLLDVIPVDILSQGILRLMEYPGAQGEVYHFSQGVENHLSTEQILKRVQPLAETFLSKKLKLPLFLPPIILKFFIHLCSLVSSGKHKKFWETQKIFIKYFFIDMKWDNAKMVRDLTKLGMNCPKFDDYLPPLMAYYLPRRKTNRLPY